MKLFTLVQNGPGSNGNEGVLHIPQISRLAATPLDVVKYHIQDIYLLRGWVLPLCKGYSGHILSPVGIADDILNIEQ